MSVDCPECNKFFDCDCEMTLHRLMVHCDEIGLSDKNVN